LALSIDFKQIREHRDSRMGGFEELCCQLAALEDPAEGSHFLRKGAGADQGLECYRTYPGGREVGWQAKYFKDGINSNQVSDISKSLKRALLAHPRLDTFVVCLPIDLRDTRVGRKLSEVQLYERWRDRSIAAAAQQGRKLTIELWSAFDITERLGRDDPAYSGRARYWFDALHFSTAWFREKFDLQRVTLGDRYSPESHIDLPIQQALLSLARDSDLLKSPTRWASQVSNALDEAEEALCDGGFAAAATYIAEACRPLLCGLDTPLAAPEDDVEVESWAAAAEAAKAVIPGLLAELRAALSERNHAARNKLAALHEVLERVRREVAGKSWRLTNTRSLVISGPAGIGKSHLLAEFGHQQVEQGRPFILVLTGTLTERDPWEQIRVQLDLSSVGTSEFLGALDAAAEASGGRAVLAVDALNEGHGIPLWAPRVLAFIAAIQRFPRLAVALTVRETYRHFLPLDGIDLIEHPGFAGRAGEAMKAYLDKRGIARPSTPNLALEFENPLFLRTCCRYLDSKKLRALPKGLDGVSAIFNFYLAAVATEVETKLGLMPLYKIPLRGLDAFLKACAAASDDGRLPLQDTIQLLEGIHNSGGRLDRNLLFAFLSEGVLQQETIQHPEGNLETVRFTFERLSDHLRAQLLLSQVEKGDVWGAFQREPLAQYTRPGKAWRYAGIREAFAVQGPERFGIEFLDLLPEDALDDWSIPREFESSLTWRAPHAFTKQTAAWIEKLCQSTARSPYGLFLLVCTDPDNPYNGEWLHSELWSRPMPQRDAMWSVFVAEDDLEEGGALETLIDWAWDFESGELDERRRELAGITLTWLLSTSNRAVRDRATKALVNLLSPSLACAAALVDRFAQVDDPYICERLLAACYGAALQGRDRAGSAKVAQAVWKAYFADGATPPLHVMSRDYAWGVLLYAQAIGRLPSQVDLGACRSKFTSPWPLEAVSEADLKKYYKRSYGNSITSSTSDHGDFGHYTVRSWLHDITTLPASLAGRSTPELYESWEKTFIETATTTQLKAYTALFGAAHSYRSRSVREWDSEEGKAESERLWSLFMKANATFKRKLSSDALATYAEFPEHHLLEATRMNDDRRRPAEVDGGMVQRWVCMRAHVLGWTEDLFEAFDEGQWISRDRMGNHRVERVGKKYQHIALAEATARLTDNLVMSSYQDDGKLRAYEYGPMGRDMKRDLDPSLLIRGTKDVGWSATPVTWWTPLRPKLPSGDTEVLLAWVQSQGDLCNGAENIEVASPDRRKWLMVHGLRHWRVLGEERRNHADAWSRISCLLTSRGSGAELARELLQEQRGDVTRLVGDPYLDCFLGEHGWRDSGDIVMERTASPHGKTRYGGMVESLRAETGTEDNSIDESFTLHLPSSGVIKALGLHLCSGKRPEYIDDKGKLRWQDPSLHTSGTAASLVSREFLLERLVEVGLEPVWVIAGEQNVYSGRGAVNNGFGGRLSHTTVFTVEGENLKQVGTNAEFFRPSAFQLKALFDSK